MSRTQTIEIATWEEADAALREMAHLDVDVARIQADLAEAVTALKAEADAKIAPLNEGRKGMETALKDFVKTHKKDLDGKSRKLTHGVVGFRQSRTTVKLLWKAARVIEALKQHRWTSCIRTKESLHKDHLLLLKDEQLAEVGCSRTEGRDKFYAEPDLASIEEKP